MNETYDERIARMNAEIDAANARIGANTDCKARISELEAEVARLDRLASVYLEATRTSAAAAFEQGRLRGRMEMMQGCSPGVLQQLYGAGYQQQPLGAQIPTVRRMSPMEIVACGLPIGEIHI